MSDQKKPRRSTLRDRLSRRTMLRGAAGALVGLPFLEAMLPRNRTTAQTDEMPKRVIFFFSACGPVPETWWPTGGETDFVFPSATSALEVHRNKLIIPDGISMQTADNDRVASNGHDKGTVHCLTCVDAVEGPMGRGEFGHLWDGSAGGISIDQHIANWVNGLENKPPLASLEVGVRAEGIGQALPSRISYRGARQPVAPIHSAAEVYDTIFAPLAQDTTAADARHRRRQLVLGSVRGDLSRLRSQVGSEDRARLDAHAASLSSLEVRLNDLRSATCAADEPAETNNFPMLGRLQMDMIVEAFKCDLTRVASIQWSNGQSGVRHNWLGHMDSHHGVSHKTRDERPSWDTSKTYEQVATEIDTWYVQQFAYLLAQLDAIDEGDGTLLDNTVVVWCNEQERGIGNRHGWDRMPYVLAGSCGGYFDTGRKVTVDAPHGELYVNVMHAMGMTDTTFGNPEYCSGPIAGLSA